MTGEEPLAAGVGVPALFGTLVLATIISTLIGSTMIWLLMTVIMPDPEKSSEIAVFRFVDFLTGAWTISMVAAPIIFVVMTLVGIPMALGFANHGVRPLIRYLISGLSSALLGAAISFAIVSGNTAAVTVGIIVALISAWTWLSMLLWVERRHLRQQSAPLWV